MIETIFSKADVPVINSTLILKVFLLQFATSTKIMVCLQNKAVLQWDFFFLCSICSIPKIDISYINKQLISKKVIYMKSVKHTLLLLESDG